MATSPRMAVIITASPLERTAVIEHLRDVGEEPELRGSIYRRGIFDERSEPWDVVVAEIGAGNAELDEQIELLVRCGDQQSASELLMRRRNFSGTEAHQFVTELATRT
jgi:hypothetical protein